MENAIVANTDRAWFDHFRPTDGLTIIDEVNFWRPLAQQRFRALSVGGPLFFRLKHPYSAVAGFGFFAGEYALSINTAWEMFGRKNGDPSYERFVSRIQDYRQRLTAATAAGSVNLSCLVLRDSVFLPTSQWIPWQTEEEWSKNIVSYKGYELGTGPGRLLAELMRGVHPTEVPDFAPQFIPLFGDERTRIDRYMIAREGQGTFRLRVFDAYGWKCAVTGEHAVPVLDAAHIQPYLGPASNHVQNGLALRTDLHRLYDGGYVTITPDLRLEVSQRLKEEFENGKVYYEMTGKQIAVPHEKNLRPSETALLWHAENVYR